MTGFLFIPYMRLGKRQEHQKKVVGLLEREAKTNTDSKMSFLWILCDVITLVTAKLPEAEHANWYPPYLVAHQFLLLPLLLLLPQPGFEKGWVVEEVYWKLVG